MRDIKFRFFCYDAEIMSNEYTIEEIVNGRYDFGHNISDCVKLQYTGLLDKNSVEIYDGDIIRFKDNVVVVEFGSHNGEVYGYHFLSDIMDMLQINVKYSDIEVIGNIYENHELLENK